MNYLNNNEIVQKDIINDTNKDSTKNQCRNIGVVSGIYKIINKVNGKYYVGNSKNIYKRWIKHKSLLRHNKHINDYLQNAFNAYGESNFEFIIVEKCLIENLKKLEQKYLDIAKSTQNDNYNLNNSHVLPALIRKFIEAKDNNSDSVEVWGTGKATREFLYVDDAVKAIIDSVDCKESGPFNLGTGVESTVKELVETIAQLVDYKGNIVWNSDRPDGQPRRFYDMSKFKETYGYVPDTKLIDGLKITIDWFKQNKNSIRK